MQDETMVKDIIDSYKSDLEKVEKYLVGEYATVRAGRANPHFLDKVMVDYYGVPTPIYQMGNISVPEARVLMINVWDQSQLQNVSKAIAQADLGIMPSDDGKVIRLIFPMMTEEKRREIVRDVRKMCEESKVTMRNHRRDCLDMFKDMKKDGELSEDEYATLEKDVQKIIDAAIARLDKICQDKENEVTQI